MEYARNYKGKMKSTGSLTCMEPVAGKMRGAPIACCALGCPVTAASYNTRMLIAAGYSMAVSVVPVAARGTVSRCLGDALCHGASRGCSMGVVSSVLSVRVGGRVASVGIER